MLWIATTPDKYELPIAVAQSADELAKMLGITKSTVVTMAWRQKNGKYKEHSAGRPQKYRIYTIEE